VPRDVPSKTKLVTVQITVAKDGRILASHITQPSGNAILDRSVQNLLETVRVIPGFKTNSSNQVDQTTLILGFSAENLTERLNWTPATSAGAAIKK